MRPASCVTAVLRSKLVWFRVVAGSGLMWGRLQISEKFTSKILRLDCTDTPKVRCYLAILPTLRPEPATTLCQTNFDVVILHADDHNIDRLRLIIMASANDSVAGYLSLRDSGKRSVGLV